LGKSSVLWWALLALCPFVQSVRASQFDCVEMSFQGKPFPIALPGFNWFLEFQSITVLVFSGNDLVGEFEHGTLVLYKNGAPAVTVTNPANVRSLFSQMCPELSGTLAPVQPTPAASFPTPLSGQPPA